MNELTLQKLLRDYAGLSEDQVMDLNHEAVRTETCLEDVVLRHGMLDRNQLYEYMSMELNVPFVDLANYILEPQQLAVLDSETARRLQVIPLFQVENTLTVAMANTDDVAATGELRQLLDIEINPVLATPEAIRDALNKYYRAEATRTAHDDILKQLELEIPLVASEHVEEQAKKPEKPASEAPAVSFVNTLLERTVTDRATDIHIEPEEKELRIRVRVDGLLREIGRYPRELHQGVVEHLKTLSAMDVSNRRSPQDGGFYFPHAYRRIDVRVHTFPTVHGENVVMRLFDKSSSQLALADLGMTDSTQVQFGSLIKQPHGIIIVTGPTGSGKTTTLYAILSALNSEEKNIITLEDPVEYHLPGIRQCQMDPKVHLTFASGLRSILRQDPNIILLGEIRDSETAELALQTALTGHLVLSALHTNDAPSALTRLIEMNVDPFLISSSVLGVLAQRLVRRVCEKCATTYSPTREVTERLGIKHNAEFKRGAGCPACNNRGFQGRTGIYELLTVSPEVRRRVMRRRTFEEIKTTALSEGMQTLREDALAKAKAGITTPDEVIRVTVDQGQ